MRFLSLDFSDQTSFTINENTLHNLKLSGIEDYITDSLEQIKNTEYLGKESFIRAVKKKIRDNYWRYHYLINKYIEIDKPDKCDACTFTPEAIYTNHMSFENINFDRMTMFGTRWHNSNENNKLDLFTPNYILFGVVGEGYYQENPHKRIGTAHDTKIMELWLDLRTISYSMYMYQTTYEKQVTNRLNPFTEPVSVFSNIENGLGIFVAKQTTTIKKVQSTEIFMNNPCLAF